MQCLQARPATSARLAVHRRCVARAAATAGINGSSTMSGDSPSAEPEEPRYLIHEIPQSQWPEGIPAVMGAHLMASGAIAPLSTSSGPGDGNVPHVFQYHSEESDISVVQHGNVDAASHALAAMVHASATKAIEEKGSFTLVLSGGSLLQQLSKLTSTGSTDFSKWWIFFVDERNVPHSSDDSTYKGAKSGFLDSTDIPATQILEIHEGLSVEEAAKNYEGRMLDVPPAVLPRNEDSWPVFDCMVLGTGPDGHIASLFPNTAALAATEGWVLPVSDSPKPPPERITMTLPVINASKAVIFMAMGAGKSDVVRRVLECQALPGALPAQLVRPKNGSVTWMLDVDASKDLQIAAWEEKKKYPRSQV